jgi:hypothetical protein
LEITKRKCDLEDLHLDERLILSYLCGRMQTGFNWLTVEKDDQLPWRLELIKK